MVKSNNKKENLCLNFVKGLACMGVVLMHCSFPSPFGRVLTFCLLFAVPVFFFTSGFFAYYDDVSIACDKIKFKIKHILKLTIISEFIYFIYYVVTSFSEKNILESLANVISFKKFFSSIFLNIPIFNGTLWFLYALLFSYIALYFIYKFNLLKISWFLSPIILVLHVVGRAILKCYDFDWYNAAYFRNFLIYGLPLLMIGNYLRANKEKLSSINNKKLLRVIFLGTPCIFIEYFISLQVLDFYICSIIVAIAIFIYAVNNPKKENIPLVAYIGKNLSMHIYILHIMCISSLGYLFDYMGINENTIVLWILPIACVALSILLAYFTTGEFFKKIKNINKNI